MKAHVGDRLIVDGEGDRVGLVIGVQHEDGTPPYVIKWLSDGHVALVFPGPYARIVPAGNSVATRNDSAGTSNGSASAPNHSPHSGNNHTGNNHRGNNTAGADNDKKDLG